MKSFPRFRAQLQLAGLCAVVFFAAACSEKAEPVVDIRPVRAMVVATGGSESVVELAGEIQARRESRLGFRVGGKVVARGVEVGTVVKRGQMLMQLDAADLQLAQAQAKAAVSVADSNLTLARAEAERYRELREKNFVSQALLDTKEAAYRAALAGHAQVSAALKVQVNQAGYAALIADVDGVVTAIEAEVGQVVAPGNPVIRIAQSGEKEVRVSIPEDQVSRLRGVSHLAVRTWAQPDLVLKGVLRELSPVADSATRTYTAKISLPEAGNDVRLGMTATVSFVSQSSQDAIRLPLTALLNDQGKTSVWVVEDGTVRLAAVQVAGASGNEILIFGGLTAGQTIVTAGINLLQPGQKVKLLGQEITASQSTAKDRRVEGALDGAVK